MYDHNIVVVEKKPSQKATISNIDGTLSLSVIPFVNAFSQRECVEMVPFKYSR